MGMRLGSSMMERHHSQIPGNYSGLTNPIPADDESIARGEEQYTNLCATCHGDGGLGDGPLGENLDPAPSNVAHTSQMMDDAYLFWRISEGGTKFGTSMPGWADILDEQTRWDLVNYMRALGSGQVIPRRNRGGNAFDPENQAAHEAEMLAKAVDQEIITQNEADIFAAAHMIVDARLVKSRGSGSGTGMDERLAIVLEELVSTGELTQEQADIFLSVHDRLGEAGLMQ
jgi:mono/diheme cytochrome c family protein